jgi:hypothetical protein
MAVDAKLLEKAQNSPQSLRFEEAVKLAEQLGWEEIGGSGSHKVFRHPDAKTIKDQFPRPLNLQEGENGKAKAYQVEQLLKMVTAMKLI